MKTKSGILPAFILNAAFALLEAMGGWFSGSISILSDAVHDVGDACVIGLALVFEAKSARAADAHYPFGYGGYSVLGGAVTALMLLLGSAAVIITAVGRLLHPVPVHSDAMLVLAVVGLSVNAVATFATRKGTSVNQRAVNLHMFEDLLGWAAVLLGAALIRLTGLTFIDPLLSVAVSLFVLIHAAKQLRTPIALLLHKTPARIDAMRIEQQLCSLDGVSKVADLRIWSTDAQTLYATVRITGDGKAAGLVKVCLRQHGIDDITVEIT